MAFEIGSLFLVPFDPEFFFIDQEVKPSRHVWRHNLTCMFYELHITPSPIYKLNVTSYAVEDFHDLLPHCPPLMMLYQDHIRPLKICMNVVSQLDEPNTIHGSPNIYKAVKLPQLSFLSSAIGEFAHMGSFSGSVPTESTQDWQRQSVSVILHLTTFSGHGAPTCPHAP